MKFVMKERGTKDLYDEILYVMFRYNKVVKNPYKRIHRLSVDALKDIIICILIFIMFLILFFLDKETKLYLIIICIYPFIILLGLVYYLMVKSRIKQFMDNHGTIEINIDQKGVKYKSEKIKTEEKWEDIKYVLINKYSICFVPKSREIIMISMKIEDKDDVINLLKKYKKENLLVDNSNLY